MRDAAYNCVMPRVAAVMQVGEDKRRGEVKDEEKKKGRRETYPVSPMTFISPLPPFSSLLLCVAASLYCLLNPPSPFMSHA